MLGTSYINMETLLRGTYPETELLGNGRFMCLVNRCCQAVPKTGGLMSAFSQSDFRTLSWEG